MRIEKMYSRILYLPVRTEEYIRMAIPPDEMRKKSNNIHKKI